MNHITQVMERPELQGCPLCLIMDFLEWASKEGFWNFMPVEDEGLLRTYVLEKRNGKWKPRERQCALRGQFRNLEEEGASAPASRRLPIIEKAGELWFVDERLGELSPCGQAVGVAAHTCGVVVDEGGRAFGG